MTVVFVSLCAYSIPEVEWSGEKILVLKNVMINPPYRVEDCQVTDSQVYQNGQSLNHVRKIVSPAGL